eukprot:5606857-Pyramimonas_sp.AAC.1
MPKLPRSAYAPSVASSCKSAYAPSMVSALSDDASIASCTTQHEKSATEERLYELLLVKHVKQVRARPLSEKRVLGF